MIWNHHRFDVLVQERHNSIVNTLELRLSCTNPLISNVGVNGIPITKLRN